MAEPIPCGKLGERVQEEVDSIGDCAVCKKPITDQHPDDGLKMIDNKPVHEDCYWYSLGDLIEQHPIHTPHIRRG